MYMPGTVKQVEKIIAPVLILLSVHSCHVSFIELLKFKIAKTLTLSAKQTVFWAG